MKKLIFAMFALALTATTFVSCEDVPAPYALPTDGGDDSGDDKPTAEAKGTGTLADPYNCVAANNVAAALAQGSETEADVYIKGIVVSVKEEYTTNYGNATYYISEDGTETNQFYVYRALYLGNKKFANGNTQIKVGDEVIICGRITNYNGTYETSQNKAYLYSLNGKTADGGSTTTGEAKGSGTLADPYNPQAANDYTSSLEANAQSENDIYIKGKVSSITSNYSTDYGNATFYISEDGTTSGSQFYVFRAYYLNNEKYTSGDLLSVGDDVVICGKVTNYYGNTPETVTNQAYLYSWTKSGGSTGGDEGEETKTYTTGITATGTTTLTLTNSAVTAGTEIISFDFSAQGYTNKKDLTESAITLSDGTTITFDKNGETNGPSYYDNGANARVYKNNIMTITGKSAIAKVVLNCTSTFLGNETATLAISGNTFSYTNVFTGSTGGGTQLRIKSLQITYAK